MKASRWVSATLALTVLACATGPGDSEPTMDDISGEWRQSANLADDGNGRTHLQIGKFNFVHDGVRLAGGGNNEASCAALDGTQFETPLTDRAPYVLDGNIEGVSVSFSTALCDYSGTMLTPTEISGSVTCSYVEDGTTFEFTGPWLAHRN